MTPRITYLRGMVQFQPGINLCPRIVDEQTGRVCAGDARVIDTYRSKSKPVVRRTYQCEVCGFMWRSNESPEEPVISSG